ncbi:unnamed protein product [Cuscuta europaea]|uniref:Uncharacterized protein n=1 Tax=Cuscuta europaea TaxID=41803 RepID=A0A9P1EAA3_CUSEU|nr:unnamed protein product [Cuscuta europaea]
MMDRWTVYFCTGCHHACDFSKFELMLGFRAYHCGAAMRMPDRRLGYVCCGTLVGLGGLGFARADIGCWDAAANLTQIGPWTFTGLAGMLSFSMPVQQWAFGLTCWALILSCCYFVAE